MADAWLSGRESEEVAAFLRCFLRPRVEGASSEACARHLSPRAARLFLAHLEDQEPKALLLEAQKQLPPAAEPGKASGR